MVFIFMGFLDGLFSSCEDLRDKGYALEKAGKYSNALEYYNKVISKCPTYDGIYLRKGLMLFKLKRYQEELDNYNAGLKKGATEITLKWMRGQVLLELGKYQEAISDLDFFIENGLVVRSDDVGSTFTYNSVDQLANTHRVWFKKGIAYYKLNKPIEALNCFNKSIFFLPQKRFNDIEEDRAPIYYARASRWRGQILKEIANSDPISLPNITIEKSKRIYHESGPFYAAIHSNDNNNWTTKETLERIADSSFEDAKYTMEKMMREYRTPSLLLLEFSKDLNFELFRQKYTLS
jgi:tetratricopeptide (TPR) repeat protein